MIYKKIKKAREISRLAKKNKSEGKKIVLATGCFDILHSGHIFLLREARKLGDVLIVGANSDLSIKKIKGPKRPIVREKMRLLNLASLVPVDYVTTFKETNPAHLAFIIKPNFLVKGGDWSGKKLPEEKVLKRFGGKIVCIPIKIATSTTAIIGK